MQKRKHDENRIVPSDPKRSQFVKNKNKNSKEQIEVKRILKS